MFIIGQRWISNTETQLGLGIVVQVESRQVKISFPAAEEDRLYAINNAPLSRIIFQEGEYITTTAHQKLLITAVNDYQGLTLYVGIDEEGNEINITEASLSSFIPLNTPQQRLLSGLLDKLETFKLRIDTLNHSSRLQLSPVRGLLGSRTNHLPHQLYVAYDVARRHAPRVLLADEVGLGKTIEAGMILHYQLQTGRAERVLIIVPETLIHQWLVEMLRRFNLSFTIIDRNRYECSETNADYQEEITTSPENPFTHDPLILCSLDFLTMNETAFQDALAAHWDLVVVDEAHHLLWTEAEASSSYACVEQLAEQCNGLLLLTATPEQVGIESHFARLRLLDPSRFYNFSLFKQQERDYQSINRLVHALLDFQTHNPGQELNNDLITVLKPYLADDVAATAEENIKALLDRHGTGRVLFRNTRTAIKGFPSREVHYYPLSASEIYNPYSGLDMLHPELLVDSAVWVEHDSRVHWLVKRIEQLRPNKILLICAQASTAITLENHLKLKTTIRSSCFHEGLTIIERDKAAAYFTEEEQGAQVLVCSEIGSEGRNFQCAHQLIFFDLPLNPDVVEQRIGRLDRIGQKHTIHIHVPYFLHSAQESLFRWYHEGLNLFAKSCSIGFSIYQHFAPQLLPILSHSSCALELNALISQTQLYTQALHQTIYQARDNLLELNSCNLPLATQLMAEIDAAENTLELQDYLSQVFQEYGIEHEPHSERSEIIRPTNHMNIAHFPCLKEEGLTITYSRTKALAREDIAFISWEHPLVNQAMEMILTSDVGKACLVSLALKNIPSGTLFGEFFYTIHCPAPRHLQLDRFIPRTPIRNLVDVSGKNLASILQYAQLNRLCVPIKRHVATTMIKQIRQPIEQLLSSSQLLAEQAMQDTLPQAISTLHQHLGQELHRLKALRQVNPAIREEEITFLQQQIKGSESSIRQAKLELQAVRIIVTQ